MREAAERVEGGGHLSHVAVPEDFRSVRFAVEVMGIRHQSGGEVAGGLLVKLLALLVAEAFEGFRVDDLPGAGRTVGGEREARAVEAFGHAHGKGHGAGESPPCVAHATAR